MTRANGAGPAADDDDAPDDEIHPEAADPEAMVPVEYGGQTYAVPPELEGALMRHADYQHRVEAVEQQRQALAAGHAALAQAMQDHGQHLADHARLMTLNDHIAQLSKVNWPALQQQNPAQAQQLMTQLNQLQQTREIAARELQHKQNVAAFNRQREQAQQAQQCHAILQRDIEGWSPAMAQGLADYAMGQGISPQELAQLTDPRLVKILHHAHLGHQALQQRSAAQRLAQAQRVRPAIQVGGTGGGPKDASRMSTDEWMRHRRGQLRKKGR
jgi:hypothetical protein